MNRIFRQSALRMSLRPTPAATGSWLRTGTRSALTAAVALTSLLPFAAQAHKPFLVPSETVLSANGWITVDAAVSNDLFYFNHQPLRLENLTIIGPDGSPVTAENINTGKFRSTFDVNLASSGTYKLSLVNSSLGGSYVNDKGETKRWRGTAEAFASEVPANAKDLKVSQNQTRIETFVTSGKPNGTALKPSGSGLELAPVTHPNDLVAGEPVSFRFLLDGKPAANVKVVVVPGGSRYRNKQGETELTTDANGQISVTWPDPGMYWLQASVQDEKAATPATSRRANYVATFEVLPP
ncbi:MAG: DUF4198 domain-containing protein [Gammaproteobacteria bacterium]